MLRYFYIWRSDYNTMLASLYWPLLDIIIWGFVGSWIQQSNNFFNYQFVALLGVLLWQVVGRGSNILIALISEELWSNNIINLFALPLKLIEYICAITFYYIGMILFTTIFCMLFIPLLYNISFISLIYHFVIFLFPCLLCGIFFGFMGAAIIITLGKRGAELAWIFSWFLLPFSGAYYPVSVLPAWGQKLSLFFPMSYIFEAMRNYIIYQKNPFFDIFYASIFGLIYAFFAIFLFVYCFNRSKKNGLLKLTE